MALKINYPEPGDNVPQWATEDTQLQIKAILERGGRPGTGDKGEKAKEEQTKKSTKALKGLAEGFDELTGLVGTTAGVLTATKGEFKDLIPIVDNFGNLVKKAGGALLKAIPIFGDALAAGGELFVEFTKDAFAFLATTADNVAESFRGAATRGAFFDNSLTALISASTSARITLEELAGILEANQSAIAAFGSASTGAQQILKNLSRVQDDYGEDLARLGLTFAEINEASSGFFDLLAQTGQASLLRAGQEGQLAAVTNRYIKDLTVLASITGQERKEVEAEFRRQVMRGNVQAQLALLNQDNTAGTTQAFGNLSTLLTAFNPILGDAFGSIATLGVATAEQEAVLAQLGNSRQLIEEFGQSFRDGTLTDAEATAQTEAIFKAISDGVKSPEFLEIAKLGTGPITGLPATLAEITSTALPLAQSLDDTEFSLEKLREEVENQTKTQDEGISKLLTAQRVLAEIPLNIQNALLGSDGGVPIINTALETVADNITKFGGVLNAIISSGGGIDALSQVFGGERIDGGGETQANPGGADVMEMLDLFDDAAMATQGLGKSQIIGLNNRIAQIRSKIGTLSEEQLKKELNSIISDFGLPIENYNRGTAGVQNFGNGTLAMLHGNEAVIPAPMGSIPVDLGNTLEPLQELITNLTNSMDAGNKSVAQEVVNSVQSKEMVAQEGVNSVQSKEVVSKLNEMIGVLKTIADGQYTGNSQFGKEIRRLGNQMSTDLFR